MRRHFDQKRWEELIQKLIREGMLRSPHVTKALRQVSREPFLPEGVKMHAAIDSPLPIGFGQTISAPLN
jgi:protein-L-isoaspartate(D-aspartate) O-methyltransferase